MIASPSLPLPLPPRRRASPGLKPESAHVYRAVMVLRRNGHRVYRAGDAHHLLDGRRVGTFYLLATADMEGLS